jgi:hypothetical protein
MDLCINAKKKGQHRLHSQKCRLYDGVADRNQQMCEDFRPRNSRQIGGSKAFFFFLTKASVIGLRTTYGARGFLSGKEKKTRRSAL